MISEKTVELNLTTELINYSWVTTHRVHFALAPSQRMEAKLGFDTQVLSNGIGVYIQYKRAYVNGNIWTWHLNRTVQQDQHLKLQNLEKAGNAVYYAFPFFHLPTEVEKFRRRLLLNTFWFKPLSINPIGGPTGHHDVKFDSVKNTWWVSSEEETEIPTPNNIEDISKNLESEKYSAPKLLNDFNNIVLGIEEINSNNIEQVSDLVVSNSAIIRF
jgi:hypothetical protein